MLIFLFNLNIKKKESQEEENLEVAVNWGAAVADCANDLLGGRRQATGGNTRQPRDRQIAGLRI